MPRPRFLLVLASVALLALPPSAPAAEPDPSPHLLIVTRPTPLYWLLQGQAVPAATLCANTYLRTLPQDAPPPFMLPGYVYGAVLWKGGDCRGWVRIADICDLSALAERYFKRHKDPPEWDRNYKGVPGLLRLPIEELLLRLRKRPEEFNPEEFKQAWKELDAAIAEGKQLAKELPEPYIARARLWGAVGNADDALFDYLTAAGLVLDAGGDLVTYAKAFKELEDGLKKVDREIRKVDYYCQDKAAAYYGKGCRQFWQRSFADALPFFDNAVQLDPAEPVYWYFRALTQRSLSRERRAMHDARIGAYLERQHSTVSDYGRITTALERIQGEERRWLESFRHGEPESQLSGAPAGVPKKAENTEESPESYARALVADFIAKFRVISDPVLPASRKEQALIVWDQPESVKQAWKEIERAVEEARKLPRQLPDPYFARASFYAATHHYDKALEEYLTALDLAARSASDPIAYAKYFRILREALDNLDRLPRPPNYGEAARHYSEGYHAFWQGDTERALTLFDEAVRLVPVDPLYRYYRGLARKRLGRDEEARGDVVIAAYLDQSRSGPARAYLAVGVELERLQGPLREWLQMVHRTSFE